MPERAVVSMRDGEPQLASVRANVNILFSAPRRGVSVQLDRYGVKTHPSGACRKCQRRPHDAVA
jgi:hypothetical protein